MAKLYATTNPEISERERKNMVRSAKIAAQGMVLLENNGVLPLNNAERKIALFGDGARYTIKGGTGSGDVNCRFVVNAEQGLEDAGYQITTKGWLDRYDKAVDEARCAFMREAESIGGEDVMKIFWHLFHNPFHQPVIIPVEQEDMEKSDTDTAIYVLSRKSGEGKDRKPIAGEYELYEEEKAAIRTIAEYYKNVIIVLNVGSVIDTKFLRMQDGISAILLMGQAGNMGGYALADVLTGRAVPGGRLSATWAENYMDYPGAANFSHMNGDIDDEYYSEGIYVGYRYFDTFDVTPAYPFGFGRSYTNFEIVTKQVETDNNVIRVKVLVKNTGNTYSGQEVVQIYVSEPDGRLEKAYQKLVGFAKTRDLLPGEEEILTIQFRTETLASYDVESASWILEAGMYYVRAGAHSRCTKIVAALELKNDVIIETVENHFPSDCEAKLLSKKDAVPYSYETEEKEKNAAPVFAINAGSLVNRKVKYCNTHKETKRTTKKTTITIDDIKKGDATPDELVGQLSVEELAEICVGSSRGGIGSTSIVGAASMTPGAAGDTSALLEESRNIRSMVLADGPAGLRLSRSFQVDRHGIPVEGTGEAPLPGLEPLLDRFPKPEIPEDTKTYYQYCTAIPIATNLAQTWDRRIIMEAGDIVGEEMNEMGISLWLAPGMNLHRNPLCGRNFEYFSEDPFLTGVCAAADTLGVQKHNGVGTTIKHFAFNNQEDNRMHMNAHIDERTVREIYLKSFEIAIKESQPMAIMTSYNLLNGTHTANNKELLDYVVRDEWGFQGIIMTDWGATGSMDPLREKRVHKYGYSSPAGCIKAGNDLIMPGSLWDVEEIVKSVGAKEGEVECPLKLSELQACAKRIIKIIMQSMAYENSVPYEESEKLQGSDLT